MTGYTEAIFFGLFRESVASGILTLWPPPKPPRPGFNEAKVLRRLSLNPQAEENAQNAQSLMRFRAVYNNYRRGSQLHISCGRRGGYRNVGRFIKKENSY